MTRQGKGREDLVCVSKSVSGNTTSSGSSSSSQGPHQTAAVRTQGVFKPHAPYAHYVCPCLPGGPRVHMWARVASGETRTAEDSRRHWPGVTQAGDKK